jgi:hypothetical protein
VSRHDPLVISGVKEDRVTGMTIVQLMAKYELPKTTVWHYIKDIALSDEARKRAQANRGGSKGRSEKEWERAQQHANDILKNIDLASAWPVLYAALYWSEGTKSSFVFTNTDERMIGVFLSILRSAFGIQNQELDFMIRTCVPMNPDECRKHWAAVAQVPESQIRINHNDMHNKSHTRYGMCRITLRKGFYHLKLVHCLFKSIADKMLEHSSRSSMDRTNRS